MSDRARPLVVVSNRLPFRAERRAGRLRLERSPGGLVAALDPVLTERGGMWIGWPGVSEEDIAEAGGLSLPTKGPVTYRAVPLTEPEVALHYGAFSNATVWPLFHYFVGRMQIEANAWRVYDRVNERFAQVAARESPEDALIWVHDYQLLRVPHHLRRFVPRARIAFFLHIPFPAADVFRVLPWARSLIRGMLAADLVALHIPAYVEHFLTCAERLLGCEVDWTAGRVQFEGREVSVEAHPISVDVARIEALAQAAAPPPAAPAPDAPLEVLGVDRLDYTKGIHGRLLAIERLLERHPGYRRRVVFTQIAVPTRERVAEYRSLKREIDEAVGRINGRFSEPGWSPIRYLARPLGMEDLVMLYRRADVALLTPLRDGMNLVAKEYVAARVDGDGVLVLSEMAGAADELQEALLVNPFDVDAVADALHRALTMPPDERQVRMSALRDRVRGHDVHAWVRQLVTAAEAAAERARATPASPVNAVRRRLAPWLAQRHTVALFLDYDGTLTPLAPHPDDAKLSEAGRRVLQEAARTPNLDTVVVSGRGLADVRAMVGVPGITYVGNHGFEIEGPGIGYQHEAVARFGPALTAAAADLEALAVPGALVEHKGSTLSYHVRGVAEAQRSDAQRRAEAVVRRHKLRATLGKCIVEGRPPVDWNKGRAVLYVLTSRHGADWPSRVRAVYVGDDLTDEDAFRSLRGIGRSICVAAAAPTGGSTADYRLPDPEAVLQLLRWFASGAFAAAKA